MRFSYCPHCGTKAVGRVVGDDGEVPFCEKCGIPLFDMFPSCVLSVVMDEDDNVLLIRQSYGNNEHFVGVAGYIKPGESAEAAAVREIKEEIGLDAQSVSFLKSIWYGKKQMLMFGFLARVKSGSVSLSGEVAEVKLFELSQAALAVRQGSIIGQLILAAKEELK